MGGARLCCIVFDSFPLWGKDTRRENSAKKAGVGFCLNAFTIGVCGALAEISAAERLLGRNAPVPIPLGCFAPQDAGPFLVDNLCITCGGVEKNFTGSGKESILKATP